MSLHFRILYTIFSFEPHTTHFQMRKWDSERSANLSKVTDLGRKAARSGSPLHHPTQALTTVAIVTQMPLLKMGGVGERPGKLKS